MDVELDGQRGTIDLDKEFSSHFFCHTSNSVTEKFSALAQRPLRLCGELNLLPQSRKERRASAENFVNLSANPALFIALEYDCFYFNLFIYKRIVVFVIFIIEFL